MGELIAVQAGPSGHRGEDGDHLLIGDGVLRAEGGAVPGKESLGGHGIYAIGVPGVLRHIGEVALGRSPQVQGRGHHGGELPAGDRLLRAEGAVLIALDQPVHGQRVDGVGEGRVRRIREGAAVVLQPQFFGQRLRLDGLPGAAPLALIELGGGRQGLQKLGERGAVIHVPGVGQVNVESVSPQAQAQGAVGHGGRAGAQQQGNGLGVLRGDQQRGNHAHRVVGGPVGGVETVGGDFQAVAVKELRHRGDGKVLVQHQLGHALTVGPLANGDTQAVGADGGGKHLGSAGAVGAGEDHHRQIGEVGSGGLDGTVVLQTVPAHHVNYYAVGEFSDCQGHRLVGSTGVGAQVHHPKIGLLFQLGEGLLHRVRGRGAEAVAVDVAHLPVHQIVGDDGDEHRPPLQRHVPDLAGVVEADGEGDGGAGLALDAGGGVGAAGEGDAVRRQNIVSGGQTRLQGRGVVQHGENFDSHALLHRVQVGDGDAHPNHRAAVDGGEETLVLLGGHIYRIGIAKGLDDSVHRALLQYLLRNLIHIIGAEKGLGVLGLQGGGGKGTQAEGQSNGQQAGKKTMLHMCLLLDKPCAGCHGHPAQNV